VRVLLGLYLFAVAACSSSTSHSARGTTPADALTSTSFTVGPSSTATTTLADGRADAVSACRKWASAGSEPNASAISGSAVQQDTARQASRAATESSRWRPLGEAMSRDVELPLTGVTPAQESASTQYLATIHSECRAIGVSIP